MAAALLKPDVCVFPRPGEPSVSCRDCQTAPHMRKVPYNWVLMCHVLDLQQVLNFNPNRLTEASAILADRDAPGARPCLMSAVPVRNSPGLKWTMVHSSARKCFTAFCH